MKRTVVLAAALAALLAIADSANEALAQRQQPMPGNLREPAGMAGQGSIAVQGSMPERGGGYYSDEFVAEDWSSGGCSDGSCGGYGCGEEGCCDDCDYGCETGGWGGCCGIAGGKPRWFFTADYLYVRASFSEAIAYIERVDDGIGVQGDIVHELNFQHESSYRFGGGYRLGCCDEEVRFNFTRFNSGASTVAPPGSIVPFEVIGPGTPTFIDAGVDVKAFDLDFRKTIPLGGAQCCDCGDDCCDPCGDPCGCGDACCPPPCPAWDITWSGGVRFADVDWNRDFVTFDTIGEVFRSADSTLDFKGGGPRVGLEGRRYFGKNGWCSVFLKGDISVLLGQMHQEIREVRELGDVLFLEAQGRRIIPVTEIEAGGSVQLSRNAMFSAGYLFSAWHDLGFRDQFDLLTLVETNYDDANILGFDGLFLRLEVGY